MKILVEGYHYPSGPAWDYLNKFGAEDVENGKKKSSSFVGYCFDKEENDCIFFLPKVVLDEKDKIFEVYAPEDILDPDHVVNSKALDTTQRNFLQELSIWVYRSLREYKRHKHDSKMLLEKSFSEIGLGKEIEGTYFDAIMAILKFYKGNKDFVMFTMRRAHSQNHKILWQKTIAKTTAIMQDGVPLYLNPISSRKEINWDEELLKIYFSILNYLNKFGFKTRLEVNTELITGALFESYLNGMGVRKLQQIKHKYFSDKTVQLWNLCYNFFTKGEQIKSSKQSQEILMAPKYDRVFEEIVDDLIGDSQFDSWKEIGDGKVIDHIYMYKSVCSSDETFYIGDSKYYPKKTRQKSGSTSTEKQFTYAREVVNNYIRNVLRTSSDKKEAWPYRDTLTEGYAVIPNFFISAYSDSGNSFSRDGLDDYNDNDKSRPMVIRQFVNRLFDRDTLWVRQYDLNFLYILSLYGGDNSGAKRRFKEKVHDFFYRKTIEMLDQFYSFYILTPKNGKKLEDVMTNDIRWTLRGMAYRTGENADTLLLAMEKIHTAESVDDDIKLYENADEIYIKEDWDEIKKVVETVFERSEAMNLGSILQTRSE